MARLARDNDISLQHSARAASSRRATEVTNLAGESTSGDPAADCTATQEGRIRGLSEAGGLRCRPSPVATAHQPFEVLGGCRQLDLLVHSNQPSPLRPSQTMLFPGFSEQMLQARALSLGVRASAPAGSQSSGVARSGGGEALLALLFYGWILGRPLPGRLLLQLLVSYGDQRGDASLDELGQEGAVAVAQVRRQLVRQHVPVAQVVEHGKGGFPPGGPGCPGCPSVVDS